MSDSLDKIFNSYCECALWSSYDSLDDSSDSIVHLDGYEISESTLEAMLADVRDFVSQAGSLLDNLDPEQIGQDFWLTRNHHGAGFWDRGLGETGDRLTDLAHSHGSYDLYIGDDSKVHGN
jgi:hypothetical protein